MEEGTVGFTTTGDVGCDPFQMLYTIKSVRTNDDGSTSEWGTFPTYKTSPSPTIVFESDDNEFNGILSSNLTAKLPDLSKSSLVSFTVNVGETCDTATVAPPTWIKNFEYKVNSGKTILSPNEFIYDKYCPDSIVFRHFLQEKDNDGNTLS